MEDINTFFKQLYQDFNDRKIDVVIARMTDDVKWANGMEGGFVYGHSGVREYWTRQFTMVSAKVTPILTEKENDGAKIKVHQVAHDMNGNLLGDEYLYHHFHFKEDKIFLFEIGEKIPSDKV